MVPIRDLQVGDWVRVLVDGSDLEGQVEELTLEQVCVRTFGDELFWYEPQAIFPLPLTEERLLRLGFSKSSDPGLNGKGQAYTHGPFVLKYPQAGDSGIILLQYAGDPNREFHEGLTVSQLQNHYHSMTKILLE